MPFSDSLQIRLPRAIRLEPIEDNHIAVRTFTAKAYVNTKNNFKVVLVKKIEYSPSWAKVDCSVVVSGIEFVRLSGSNGTIPLEHTLTEREPVDILLFNNSIDTEVRFTLLLQGYAYGEG